MADDRLAATAAGVTALVAAVMGDEERAMGVARDLVDGGYGREATLLLAAVAAGFVEGTADRLGRDPFDILGQVADSCYRLASSQAEEEDDEGLG